MVALALTATTVGFGAMFLSPGRTGAGIASVLGNAQPLMVVALAAAVLGEPMTRGKWLTLAFGMTGVTLIAWQALVGPGAYGLSGAMLALTASADAAVGSVIFKRMRVTIGLLAITAWQLILGSLPLLAASALTERSLPVAWTIAFVGQLSFLALVGTSFVNAAWYWLVQRGEVSRLALYLFLVPVFGLGIAALAFGERLSGTLSIGNEASPRFSRENQSFRSRGSGFRPSHWECDITKMVLAFKNPLKTDRFAGRRWIVEWTKSS